MSELIKSNESEFWFKRFIINWINHLLRQRAVRRPTNRYVFGTDDSDPFWRFVGRAKHFRCVTHSFNSFDFQIKTDFDYRFRGRSASLSPLGQLTTQVESLTYNMKHRSRGKCLIFNNKCFDIHTRLNERKGTEMDGKALYGLFRSLDFDVQMYCDAPSRDIIAVLETGIQSFIWLIIQ